MCRQGEGLFSTLGPGVGLCSSCRRVAAEGFFCRGVLTAGRVCVQAFCRRYRWLCSCACMCWQERVLLGWSLQALVRSEPLAEQQRWHYSSVRSTSCLRSCVQLVAVHLRIDLERWAGMGGRRMDSLWRLGVKSPMSSEPVAEQPAVRWSSLGQHARVLRAGPRKAARVFDACSVRGDC